jgi:hypothetical protein
VLLKASWRKPYNPVDFCPSHLAASCAVLFLSFLCIPHRYCRKLSSLSGSDSFCLCWLPMPQVVLMNPSYSHRSLLLEGGGGGRWHSFPMSRMPPPLVSSETLCLSLTCVPFSSVTAYPTWLLYARWWAEARSTVVTGSLFLIYLHSVGADILTNKQTHK